MRTRKHWIRKGMKEVCHIHARIQGMWSCGHIIWVPSGVYFLLFDPAAFRIYPTSLSLLDSTWYLWLSLTNVPFSQHFTNTLRSPLQAKKILIDYHRVLSRTPCRESNYYTIKSLPSLTPNLGSNIHNPVNLPFCLSTYQTHINNTKFCCWVEQLATPLLTTVVPASEFLGR